eukprot:jgi/Mesvir1/2296/Mv19332-RA.1
METAVQTRMVPGTVKGCSPVTMQLTPTTRMAAKPTATNIVPSWRPTSTRGAPILCKRLPVSRVVNNRQPARAQQKAHSGPEPQPIAESITVFAPATVANLGPGFDIMGCAVSGAGDTVVATIRRDIPGQVVIGDIQGDNGRLTRVAAENSAGVGAIEVMKLLGIRSVGLEIRLNKGLPLGSGLGSSAASAAAGAWAANAIFGAPLKKHQLVPAGLAAEAVVSGYHADNVAPSLMGGFVLIRSYDPLDIIQLAYGAAAPKGTAPSDLYMVTVTPLFEAPTKEMRAVLPKEISMKEHVKNSGQAAGLVNAILTGNARMLGNALGSDTIVQPVREPLIPGFKEVREAAVAVGAYGCAISGAGPTAVAICDDPDIAQRAKVVMIHAFQEAGGLKASGTIGKVDMEGARTLK